MDFFLGVDLFGPNNHILTKSGNWRGAAFIDFQSKLFGSAFQRAKNSQISESS